jgi:aerobic-type carbon monoxide dehydrogenase small subunit (CoxS/CutS family)
MNTVSRRARKRRAKWRLAGMIKLAHGCIDCGYAASAAALQFDHIGNDKKANVSDLIRSDYSWQTIKKEIAKCVVRCANCHAVITARRKTFDAQMIPIHLSSDASMHSPSATAHSAFSVRQ